MVADIYLVNKIEIVCAAQSLWSPPDCGGQRRVALFLLWAKGSDEECSRIGGGNAKWGKTSWLGKQASALLEQMRLRLVASSPTI
jgi:hypothetical protein